MKKINLSLCTVVLLAAITAQTFLSSQSQAGVLIEPYVGYSTGKWKCNDSSCASPNSESTSGVTYGGRLGYQMMGFMFGADYLSGSWTDSYSGTKDTYTPSDLGLFVGFDFPVLLRVYATYVVSSTINVSQVQGGVTTTGKGTGNGMKIGVGFKVLPLLVVNLEYLQDSITKETIAGQTINISPATTFSMYGLSISIPFDL